MPRTARVKSVGMRGLYAGLRAMPQPNDVGLDPGGRGPKNPVRTDFTTPGSFSFTVTRGGFYKLYAFGAGGQGGVSAGTEASEGGAGGASKKTVYLRKGQTVAITVPAGGSGGGQAASATITLPDGTSFGATGGFPGAAGFVPGGNGGNGFSGDVNRLGGIGRGDTNPDGDPNTQDGVESGTFGQGNPEAVPGSGAAFTAELSGLAGGRGGGGHGGGGLPTAGSAGAASIVGPEN